MNKGNFDLNISNYKKEELEELLGLPPNYTLQLIEKNSLRLKENILNDQTIPALTRDSTIFFINSAKDKLTKELNILSKFEQIVSADIYNLNYDLKPSYIEENNSNHPIIEKAVTAYAQSFPSEYYQGTINPLKKRVLTKNLNIDTRFRENYYNSSSTNFHLDLPIKFSNVLSIQLSAFEFTATYYIISKASGNNFFWINSNTSDESIIENDVVVIQDGNYSPQELISCINNYINTTFSKYVLLSQLVFALNISGTSNGSGKIIVGVSGNNTIIFSYSLNFQANLNGDPEYGVPLPLKLGWILGFREGYYENNLNYISEGICDTSGPNYMYLVIDDYNNSVNNNFVSAFNSSVLNKNILARISLQTASFNTLIQNNLTLITTKREYFGPVDIQKLHIQLINEFGQVIDLNNMDYSFCLNLQTVYDI